MRVANCGIRDNISRNKQRARSTPLAMSAIAFRQCGLAVSVMRAGLGNCGLSGARGLQAAPAVKHRLFPIVCCKRLNNGLIVAVIGCTLQCCDGFILPVSQGERKSRC